MKKARSILVTVFVILLYPTLYFVEGLMSSNPLFSSEYSWVNNVYMLVSLVSAIFFVNTIAFFLITLISFEESGVGKVTIRKDSIIATFFERGGKVPDEIDFCACYWTMTLIFMAIITASVIIGAILVGLFMATRGIIKNPSYVTNFPVTWSIAVATIVLLVVGQRYAQEITYKILQIFASLVLLSLLAYLAYSIIACAGLMALLKGIGLVVLVVGIVLGSLVGMFFSIRFVLQKTFVGRMLDTLKNKTCLKISTV